jgi:hypothetical protein
MITRRAAMTMPIAAAAGPAVAAAESTRRLDPVADLPLIQLKLQHRADDGPVFIWMVGTKYGQIDAAVTPLFNMQVGTIARVRQLPGGVCEMTSVEVVFYTDLDSGAWLRRFKNPYTGATVEVNHGPLGPGTVSFGADGTRQQPTREVGGAVIEGGKTAGPAFVFGGDVWVRTDSHAKVTQKDGSGRPFQVNEMLEYHAQVADVLDAKRPFIPTTSHLQEVTSWAKWLGMGDRPGNMAARCVGAKVGSYAEMPELWRKLMAEAHPEIAKDPFGALSGPAARLER